MCDGLEDLQQYMLYYSGKIFWSSKVVTITEKTAGGNETSTSKDARVNSDGTNGKGADANIKWNPNGLTGGVDVNGNTSRPTQVGLGHELIHANHDINGQNDPSSSGQQDPDGSGQVLSKEEVKTRHEENQISAEQNVPNRKI